MVSARVKRSAGGRRLPQPFRQGDLDGLCGVYSTVNAVRVLCPEVDRKAAEWLFEVLMYELPELGRDTEAAVSGGIERPQLAGLIRAAIRYMAEEYEIRLQVNRVPREMRHSANLQVLWEWLAEGVSSNSVAVIGLGGRQSHWTVATHVTARQIRLFDSGRTSVLKRSTCTVGRAARRNGIGPLNVFLIKRRQG